MLVENKEHLKKGIPKIIYLKSALNNGLTEDLKLAFPTVPTLLRPVHTVIPAPLNPHWVTGFLSRNGSFTVSIEAKTGYVNLRFSFALVKKIFLKRY